MPSDEVIIYLVRRHPPHPFNRGYLEAYTIYGVFRTLTEAKLVANKANQRSRYLHTTKRLKVPQ